MHLKNWKKLYNERGITFFHETERYVNNLNIYNRSKNGTNLWDDLIVILMISSNNCCYCCYLSLLNFVLFNLVSCIRIKRNA